MNPAYNKKLNKKLKKELSKRIRETFDNTIDNPVLKAHRTWSILSEQLLAMLGEEVHTQWFKSAQPLVMKNNNLIVSTKSQFAAQWINTHYQSLVDALILAQDPKYSCFFIAPKRNN
ncbi:MAG: DnaA N-terminal domain-containing protein [Bdellovibrionota bacterium]|nr:DnaA N-terminal domain-containing protein [Bdellovibrionota bacterium]